ncbi:MAG: hypothetical protein L3K03_01900 [Thermoplasmata archaeon]|nr:hypothetical protein [Thermoplasmata archaeon]
MAGDSRLTILGVIRGLVSEAPLLEAALEEIRPEAVGLALSTEEVQGLRDYFVGKDAEPFVPILGSEAAEIRVLSQFGEVRIPHPSFLAAVGWADAHGVPTLPVDPNEEIYAEMFGSTIGYTELVRRTLRERRLLRKPPHVDSAEGFVLFWDHTLNGRGASRRLAEKRDAAAALEVQTLRRRYASLAIIAERERTEGLARALAASPA